eukprot:CAMPEP_0197836666 /NCGR_PEP_ID=MMETSP1437-20131217/29669_1 /TAXON_ID=49252 ORGANISM="Eucampia antarctica, Strain CCMP1452" /NCGR_SAMPLE_ID=MMETSP1437 /ASSEMBLY_ACC=CAM_ASM_001096 /LENGTH=74 /DNA_ID=CAMNT_0043443027 /DNA_START=173 /DNA_END=394 /DNA_ORIENTATION=+
MMQFYSSSLENSDEYVDTREKNNYGETISVDKGDNNVPNMDDSVSHNIVKERSSELVEGFEPKLFQPPVWFTNR